jgi:hypothetical protein
VDSAGEQRWADELRRLQVVRKPRVAELVLVSLNEGRLR